VHLPWRPVCPGPGLRPVPTSILAEEAARLHSLAAAAGKVLEVGSAYGYSAAVMGLAGARVTAVDPHTWIAGSQAAMQDTLADAGLDGQVTVLAATSQAALPGLDGGFGLVFIDGDHTAPAIEHDLTWAARLTRPGGVVAVHDYGEDCCCPDVRAVVDRLHPDAGTVTGTLWEMRV
jgi:predicted O-methyltransferase YrrM